LSQYSDHEEEEEDEEEAAVAVATPEAAPEATVKKEDERVMRRSLAEASDDGKPGAVAFIRRKRRSTTVGEQVFSGFCSPVENKRASARTGPPLFPPSLRGTAATRSPCHGSVRTDVVYLQAAPVCPHGGCVREPARPGH